MKAFLEYFFGVGTEIEFTNFTLAHFLPILVAVGVIYAIFRFREPLRGYRHEPIFRYVLAYLPWYLKDRKAKATAAVK